MRPLTSVPSTSRRARLATEAALLAMVVIWAGNFSLVKSALRDMAPLPFNAVRLAVATALFLAVIAWQRSRSRGRHVDRRRDVFDVSTVLDQRDWIALGVVGLVGHVLYQLAFMSGLARTSVANSALIMGSNPVIVAVLSAAIARERLRAVHWGGILLSVAGLYLVAGRGARLSGESLVGDLLIVGAVCSWALYAVLSRPLLERHSPLLVTGVSMAIGTGVFVILALPTLAGLDWRSISAATYVAAVLSAVLALDIAYLIYYASVQRIGPTMTAMASNLVPLAAMVIAWITLGERADALKWVGAGLIVSGVALTRIAPSAAAAVSTPPPEE